MNKISLVASSRSGFLLFRMTRSVRKIRDEQSWIRLSLEMTGRRRLWWHRSAPLDGVLSLTQYPLHSLCVSFSLSFSFSSMFEQKIYSPRTHLNTRIGLHIIQFVPNQMKLTQMSIWQKKTRVPGKYHEMPTLRITILMQGEFVGKTEPGQIRISKQQIWYNCQLPK